MTNDNHHRETTTDRATYPGTKQHISSDRKRTSDSRVICGTHHALFFDRPSSESCTNSLTESQVPSYRS